MTTPKKKRKKKTFGSAIEHSLPRCKKCGGKLKVSGRFVEDGENSKYALGAECQRCGDWT